jgi:RimJ/RimL family protein N-acetyltransferase
VAYCFDAIEMSVIRASTNSGNRASARVLEKLGFAFVSRREVGGLDTVFYEVQRIASRSEP